MSSGEVFYRDLENVPVAVDVANRIVRMTFASEALYLRGRKYELVRMDESFDTSLLNAGATALVNHRRDMWWGGDMKIRVEGGKAHAEIKASRSPLGEQILQEAADGILKLASYGYTIHERQDGGTHTDGIPIERVSARPFEISILSTQAADPSVGVGKREEEQISGSGSQDANRQTSDPEKEKNHRAEEAPTKEEKMSQANGSAAEAVRENKVDVQVIENEALKRERERVREIRASAEVPLFKSAIKDIAARAQKAESDGTEAKAFRDMIHAELTRASAQQVQSSDASEVPEKDLRRYSFQRAVLAAAAVKEGHKPSGLEGEMHVEALRKGSEPAKGGFIIPWDVLRYRDNVVGTATAGGHLVASNLAAGSFIDVLRARVVVTSMGARILSGLRGNVPIPRQTAAHTVSVPATEQAAATESQIALDQVTLTPKQAHGLIEYSHMLLAQATPDIEMLLKDDLNKQLALKIDEWALRGDGTSGNPTGIASTSNIGSVVGGTNGAAVAWTHIVDLETEVAVDNADMGALGYIINPSTRGKCKKTETFTNGGKAIWDNSEFPLNGYRVGVTTQVRNNLTKGTASGVCSELFFGNFNDLLIGMWNGVELLVDPYTKAGTRSYAVHSWILADIAVRHPESFARMADALTT